MGGKGSGGHNRKPTAQKKAEGNRGRRELNEAEPVPPAGEILTPADLSPLELTFWNLLMPVVTGMKVMTTADVFALKQLCRFLAEEEQCTIQLNKIGRMIPKKNEAGQVVGVTLNPIARLRDAAARHVRAYLAVFGLGPSFRSAISGAGANSNDPPQDAMDNVRSAKTSSEVVQ
jgi:P27 family predicted phage terminase small subunit